MARVTMLSCADLCDLVQTRAGPCGKKKTVRTRAHLCTPVHPCAHLCAPCAPCADLCTAVRSVRLPVPACTITRFRSRCMCGSGKFQRLNATPSKHELT